MDKERANHVLSTRGWLSRQPKAFQKQVLARAMLEHFEAGEWLYRFDDPLGGIYGVVTGAVTITTGPPAELPRLLHVGLPGHWTGEGSYLVRERRRIGMQAAVDTWAAHLPLDAMDRITTEDPAAVHRFTKILMSNIDILVRAFYELQHPDAHKRVALALLRVSGVPGSVIPLSQADLGVMSNTMRKQVNEALQRFTDGGWVSKRYRAVVLEDVDALRAFAAGEAA